MIAKWNGRKVIYSVTIYTNQSSHTQGQHSLVFPSLELTHDFCLPVVHLLQAQSRKVLHWSPERENVNMREICICGKLAYKVAIILVTLSNRTLDVLKSRNITAFLLSSWCRYARPFAASSIIFILIDHGKGNDPASIWNC